MTPMAVTAQQVSAVRSQIQTERTVWVFSAGMSPRRIRCTRKREQIIRVAAHPNAYVRKKAARAPYLPEDIAMVLAGDRDSGVLSSLIRNPNCPPEALAYIIAHRPKWAYTILAHPNCPERILRSVYFKRARPETRKMFDSCQRRELDRFRQIAMQNSNLPAAVVYDPRRVVKNDWYYLIARPDCPPEVLIDIANRAVPIGAMMDRFIENPNTPTAAFDAFLRGVSSNFQAKDLIAIARHPNVSVKALRYIHEDFRKTVVAAAAEVLASRIR